MRNCVKRKKNMTERVVQTCCYKVVQILVLIGLYFLKCTKFDQLILRKIIKIVATKCQILTLKCTKIDFGSGSAQTPLGELTALPQTP